MEREGIRIRSGIKIRILNGRGGAVDFVQERREDFLQTTLLFGVALGPIDLGVVEVFGHQFHQALVRTKDLASEAAGDGEFVGAG